MTIREEISNHLAKLGLTKYAFCKTEIAKEHKITLPNLCDYLKGKDTLSIKKLEPVLDYLRKQAAALNGNTDVQVEIYTHCYTSLELTIATTRSMLRMSVTDSSNNQPQILIEIRIMPDTDIAQKTKELMKFITSQLGIDPYWEEYKKNAGESTPA
jgi:hypothetical protein